MGCMRCGQKRKTVAKVICGVCNRDVVKSNTLLMGKLRICKFCQTKYMVAKKIIEESEKSANNDGIQQG